MSDKDKEQEPLAADTPEAEPLEVDTPEAGPPEAKAPRQRSGNAVAWLAFLAAIVALAASGYVAWNDWRTSDDTGTDDTLARLDARVAANAAALETLDEAMQQVSQQPTLSEQDLNAAIATLRADVDEQIRLLSSLPARISTLESSVASLAGVSEGARDAWVIAESEYYMQIANAQLQLANNPHLAALALRLADERIVQLANPALTDVRRAISDELAALEIMERPDIEGATLTLASLARVVESLPLASEREADEPADEIDPELSGASRAWASIKNAMSGLVKVTPPESAKLARLSPDGEVFLRNNIALQLQSARLALLRGEQAIFEQTLDDTSALLNDYFDTESAAVQGALETIGEIRQHVFTTDMPDISESLRLLRQYRTLNENAQ